MPIKNSGSKPNPSARRRHCSADTKAPAEAATHGLARVLSKSGFCSRTQAQALIRDGRVRVNGRVARDPEQRTHAREKIAVDGQEVAASARVYLMLNKPRGYVTTASDEHSRKTVYTLLQSGNLADGQLPWVAPVGRLDKSSEGLLLFSNDSAWAAKLTDPAAHLDKTYHVHIDALPDKNLLALLRGGVDDEGEWLAAKSVCELRRGEKNAWLEIVLDEGRNRQIRRLLAAFEIEVLRLVRVAIGSLALGDLAKGQWRELSASEVADTTRSRPS